MSDRSRQPWWDSPRVRTAHVRAWSTLTGTFVAVGAAVAVAEWGWLATVLGLSLGTAVMASYVLAVVGERTHAYGVALRAGVLVPSVIMATAALAGQVGPLSGPPAALVVLGWPGWSSLVSSSYRSLRSRLRGHAGVRDAPARESSYSPVPGTVDMSAFEAMILDAAPATPEWDGPGRRAASPLQHLPSVEVCRLWRRTFVLLAQAIPPEMVMQLISVRDQCLQELEARAPGAYRQLIHSGETPTSDLRGFFHGSGDSYPA